MHSKGVAGPWYDDLLELARFGNVLGQWTTLSRYLNEVLAGEYATAPTADEFHGDWSFEGLAKMTRFGFDLGMKAANQPALVEWQKADEFEAARLSSRN